MAIDGIDVVGDGVRYSVPVPPPRLPLSPEERKAFASQFNGDLEIQMPGMMELEIMHGVTYPHPNLENIYESGCAEPWTTQLIASMLIASNQRNVLETGCFTGQTSAWLACALERLGGGELTVVDIDPERVRLASERLAGLDLKTVKVNVVEADVLRFLPTLPNKSIGYAWVDDNHEHHHVAQELYLLWDKMKPGGIITGHDVMGSCNLQVEFKKFGGICLDLPRLGAAGGIGIIPIPR